jgi:hypothetical protein
VLWWSFYYIRNKRNNKSIINLKISGHIKYSEKEGSRRDGDV